jgi:hypothetical protein
LNSIRSMSSGEIAAEPRGPKYTRYLMRVHPIWLFILLVLFSKRRDACVCSIAPGPRAFVPNRH